MLNSYSRLSVPAELKDYYRVTDVIKKERERDIDPLMKSEVSISRDPLGYVSSVKYYTPEKELSKEVFYQNEEITKINYYRNGYLYSTEGYNSGLLVLKFIFMRNGYISHSYEYEYAKNNKLISISKKNHNCEITVVYKYDDFGRISARKIYINSEEVFEQHFGYDILDRISEYSDNNQSIKVKALGKKNELLSYVITDRIGNEIEIENEFNALGYAYTKISINGHYAIVKDTSYVDNIMLKKPYTNEDDLDLIIANLFCGEKSVQTNRGSGTEQNCVNIIDKSIEKRVLPISMRKRLLYKNNVSNV